MRQISLPSFHLLRASELLAVIIENLQEEFGPADLKFFDDVPEGLFCEADQQQFVDSIFYIIELSKNHLEKFPAKDDESTLGIIANEEDGFFNLLVINNSLKLDTKSAEAASSSTVQLLFEYDSKVGNQLTLSFPATSTSSERPKASPQTKEEKEIELAR